MVRAQLLSGAKSANRFRRGQESCEKTGGLPQARPASLVEPVPATRRGWLPPIHSQLPVTNFAPHKESTTCGRVQRRNRLSVPSSHQPFPILRWKVIRRRRPVPRPMPSKAARCLAARLTAVCQPAACPVPRLRPSAGGGCRRRLRCAAPSRTTARCRRISVETQKPTPGSVPDSRCGFSPG